MIVVLHDFPIDDHVILHILVEDRAANGSRFAVLQVYQIKERITVCAVQQAIVTVHALCVQFLSVFVHEFYAKIVGQSDV